VNSIGANPGFPVNAVAPSTLLGAFLEIASWLQEDERQGEKPAELLARWRRRGLRAFEADKTDAAD